MPDMFHKELEEQIAGKACWRGHWESIIVPQATRTEILFILVYSLKGPW